MGTLSVQPPAGACRSLTEVFVLLRNNAIQSKQIFSQPSTSLIADDRMSLVPLDEDVEAGGGGGGGGGRVPPDWVSVVDEVQYEMSRVRGRLRDLKEAQRRHLARPGFGDDAPLDETAIDGATHDVTKMLSHCHRLIEYISQQQSSRMKRGHLTLLRNVLSSLTLHLQQMTQDFRQSQTAYLKRIQQQDDGLQQYFEAFSADSRATAPSLKTSASAPFSFAEDEPAAGAETAGELSMAQIQAMEENAAVVKEREREVLQVTRSIVELNQLFKDLAAFVVDQGTVVDRIDYNIEQSSVRVKAALKSVIKADQYQRKNRKMHCIVILVVTIIVLLLLLTLIN